MDFYNIKERSIKNGVVEIYPDFKVGRSKDLMIRGRSFYAIWDEENNLWSTDEYDVQKLVDSELIKAKEESILKTDNRVNVKLLGDYSTMSWTIFRNYLSNLSDNAKQLDTKLTFSNTDVKKKDYVSKRLNYPLEKGNCDSYDELVGTLYSGEERAKIEWAIGAIIAGDSKDIQKFIVFYGDAGAGKSTILNIIQKLFHGYYTTFEAKALTSSSNSFSTEVFKANPLVAIQHDGDLSKIEDNTKLNSIVSHEEMTMNEKYKPSYTSRVNCFLFMATNKPVKITDAKSGIIRRLIDVKPTGDRIPGKRYQALMSQIDFELGAIAHHCLDVYREMGKNYYSSYRPLDMMMQTDIFFNFVESNYYVFKEQEGISLNQAYAIYKEYCDDALVEYKLQKHKFREELKNYFKCFHDRLRVDNVQIRSYYQGFLTDKFDATKVEVDRETPNRLVLEETKSIIDDICSTCPAQYANSKETPSYKWHTVDKTLSDIKTNKLHYVKLPLNHIVIDFDLKDDKGQKSIQLNTEAASLFPSTYAEFSKSGAGIHLHYYYEGDVEQLSRIYSEGIEVKISIGDSSLRRKLSKCNNIPIATINSGLALKGVKMLNFEAVKSENGLREMIKRNLHKEIHPGTKPSMDFIHKILEDAYSSGLTYDLTNMRPAVLAFANNSTNQSDYCLKLISRMKFKSEEINPDNTNYPKDDLVFFDVEVFPNLFIVCWKVKGGPVVRMINPTPADIEPLLSMKLIGFNNRRYDNHMMYACYIGYDNAMLYKLSQRIINNSSNCMFGEAYNLSYADIYEFSSKKQSLKKFEIELGIHHLELGLKWTEPVPEELWIKVGDYCANDVVATEAVFDDRKQDFVARKIIAELSGLSVNDTTQQHAAKIIFGNDQRPQDKFVYTDLSETFPGYKYEFGKSSYRGEDPSEGGYVYSEPGMYTDVALLDLTSMHPKNLIVLNAFGPYTKRFEELVDARVAVKYEDHKKASVLLGGILKPYLSDSESMDELAYALKIVINIIYGMTSAKFDNKFKDPKNIDNIVAKRGALFMIDLKHAVQEKGFTVAHIKTDSIKIPNATKEIIDFVCEFAKKYDCNFEHEATYSKFCLVNDAVYIAKYGWAAKEKLIGTWSAVGAQFAQPYVYKTLFTKEPILFEDLCETKAVSTALYLDMNELLPEDEHSYHFVGKVGSFCPIEPYKGGGELLREKEDKYYAATGTKGYRWLESEVVKTLNKQEDIDHGYYRTMVDKAIKNISQYGDFEQFVSDHKCEITTLENMPWALPCGEEAFESCTYCPDYIESQQGNECKKGFDVLPF